MLHVVGLDWTNCSWFLADPFYLYHKISYFYDFWICVLLFTGGASPASEAKGHPAICEPVTSEDCKAKNTWIALCAAANVTVTTSAVTPTTSAASGLTIASGVITTILVTAQTLI